MKFDELYRHELEERERLRASANVTIGALALLAGLLGSMLQGVWFDGLALSIAFGVLAGVAASYFLRGLYFLIRCYHGHTYKVMPSPMDCKDYRDALRQWHAQYGSDPAAADSDFATWLEDAYAAAAERNAQINWARSGCLYKANGATIFCVVLTLAATIPYYVHRRALPASVQKVDIVDVLSNASPAVQKVEIVGVPASPPVQKVEIVSVPTSAPVKKVK